ncbi:hypothetical protein [Rhizohabitans arisaemae]|uniref:hypothetical protein n=1 Tax=Rhizohabitans arisaemae TaxID=2720610 RepID=UPI0024B09C78|nr:hypothetical protein [Rhizohabitans arisaemae]
MLTDLVTRLRAIADGLPMGTLESARQDLGTAAEIMVSLTGSSSWAAAFAPDPRLVVGVERGTVVTGRGDDPARTQQRLR